MTILAGIAFIYLYFVPYFPALNNPNENSRLYQVRAAVELHQLSINEQIARFGMVNDLGSRDGKYYPGKAPGTTFIGVPIYAGLHRYERARGHSDVSSFRLTYAVRLGGSLLPTLGFVALFRRFMRRFVESESIANVLAILLALGTMLITYALIYVNHSLTAVTAFGVVMATHAALRAKPTEAPLSQGKGWAWLWLAVAGFLLALTATLDYALLPVAVILLGYVPWRYGFTWESTVGTALGALVPSVATGMYHQVCWGSPFKLSVGFLANPQFATNHATGLFGIVGPSARALNGTILSASKGLLYFAPVFAIGLVAVVVACFRSRSRKDAVLSAVVVYWMIGYAISLVNWDGGWTIGPRYMTVVVPFVVFSMGLAWVELGPAAQRLVLPLVGGLGIVSVLVMTMTSVLFPHFPPEYANPAYELIWPLWRDGLTPYSFGRRWLGLAGHTEQIPFLLVLGALVAYVVWVSSGAWIRPARRPVVAVGSAAAALFVVVGLLRLGTVVHTDPPVLVQVGTAWIRTAVWFPPRSALDARH